MECPELIVTHQVILEDLMVSCLNLAYQISYGLRDTILRLLRIFFRILKLFFNRLCGSFVPNITCTVSMSKGCVKSDLCFVLMNR